jgi:DNA-directed RNA polymerase subunit RPC12/RpoP
MNRLKLWYVKTFIGPVYTCVRCGKTFNANKVGPRLPVENCAVDLICWDCATDKDYYLGDEDRRFGRWMKNLPLDWRK